MEFIADRRSRPDRRFGRVAGYIVGNEVNSHWMWCNRGHVTMEEFADDYLQAVRLAHGAVHRHVDHPREGGLRLRLRRYVPGAPEPRPKKKSWECFRVADTPEWEKTFEFALPLVGFDS